MKRLDVMRPVILYSHDASRQTVDCDSGDCACSLPVIASAHIANGVTWPELHQFILSPGSQQQSLSDGYHLIYGPFHRPVVLNQNASDIRAAFNQPEQAESCLNRYAESSGVAYIEPTIRALQMHGLLQRQDESQTMQSQPHTLSVWMHVTDRCNLRCAYCYLPHLCHDMPLETGYAAIDAALRSATLHGYAELKLKYAGGEPLLCFDTIIKLHQYAQTQSTAHGITISGAVLTNGTLLTPDNVEALRDLGLRLMVSLDGIGSAHDAQRPYASGRGSFADVAHAVEIAIAGGLPPDISITVTGKSAAHLPEVIAWVLNHDLPFNLNFYRENQCSDSLHDLQIEEQMIIAGMLATYQVIEQNLPRRSLLGSLVDRANLTGLHLKTCTVGDSYMVFDYQGRVAKCQMQIDQPVTTVAAADPLAAVRDDQSYLLNLSVEEKEGCKSCAWKYWCTGGCPLTTFRATGRYDVKSPHCHIYMALYPHVMRLEGLRLLRYGLSVVL